MPHAAQVMSAVSDGDAASSCADRRCRWAPGHGETASAHSAGRTAARDAGASLSASGSATGTAWCDRAAGSSKICSGVPSSTMMPASKKTMRSATARAKPISCVTHEHRHARSGQLAHDVQHLVDHLRVEGGGGLVEEHDLGLHGQRAGDGHALLLAAGQLAGYLCACSGMPTRSSSCMAVLLGLLAVAALRTRMGPSVMFSSTVRCGNRLNDWKTMPISLRMAAMLRMSLRELDAVDDDVAALVLLEPVDGADEGRLARARRARR